MNDEEFYRTLTRDNLQNREGDGSAKRELTRRDVRDNLRMCQSVDFWSENPFQAVDRLRESTEKIDQYNFDVKEDFETDIGMEHKKFFSRLVSTGNHKAAQLYAEETDVDEDHIDNMIEMQAYGVGNYKSAFALADLLGREDLMEDIAEPIYDSLDEGARPLFNAYLEEQGLDTPNSVESSVAEAKEHYSNRAEKIENQIARLESELEETQNHQENYDRFLG